MAKNILWFKEVDKDDIPLVGGKGANLGELTKAGLPVPPGFIVTAQAYFNFVKATGLDKTIKKDLAGLDPEDSKKLNQVALKIQKAIMAKLMPGVLAKQIIKSYQELYMKGASNIFVAVRSSATAEDLPTASFAGQQKTFLNISGSEAVVRAVRECWHRCLRRGLFITAWLIILIHSKSASPSLFKKWSRAKNLVLCLRSTPLPMTATSW